MIVKFICNCRHDVTTSDLPDAILTSRDSKGVGYDDDGLLVCLEHMERRYGWRSIPISADNKIITSLLGRSPVEIEQYILFNKPFKDVSLELK